MSTQVTTTEAEAILKKLEVKWKTSTHHRAGFVYVDGVRALPVHFSHGKKTMPGHIGDKFRRSLLLNQDEFNVLRRCTMTRLEWIALVVPRLSSAAD
jgi:hypothetical protein